MTNPITPMRIVPTLSPQDLADLKLAAANLEGSSFAVTLANKVGMPVEALLRFLPDRAQSTLSTAVDQALQQCLSVALSFSHGGSKPNRRSHTFATAVTGAVGGFFGLPGLLVELPVTTTVMLHSIAGIAASQGEDLSRPDSALACLEVLALGPEGRRGEALESAYYATPEPLWRRLHAMPQPMSHRRVWRRKRAPALISFLARIASRFGIEVKVREKPRHS